jgi:hypothetical protein
MKRLSSMLPGLLRSLNGNEDFMLAFLQEVWPKVAGRRLAEQAKVAGLKGKTLKLTVKGAVWQQQVQGLEGMLLAKIDRLWGKGLIERIAVEPDLD